MAVVCDLRTKKEKKLRYPYDKNHKYSNGLEYKFCPSCDDWHLLNEEWFYRSNTSSDGFHPYCKDYTIKKSRQWEIDHPEEYGANNKRKIESRRFDPVKQQRNRVSAKKSRLEGYQVRWRKENKHKVKEYANRRAHKQHDIIEQEWFACLDFFDNSCAYCSLTEIEQLKLYGEQFHKEHVVHDGNNYIDNCVPSCTSCNARKNSKGFNEWYNEANEVFSKRRLNKIVKWMTSECFKVLNIS